MSRRLLLPLLTTLLALLALEGVLSLLDGPRIAERLRPVDAAPGRDASQDGAREGARDGGVSLSGRVHSGLYAVHPDPRVGYRFRASSDLSLVDADFRTNALGFRAWHGDELPEERLDLLVLGDSVAFGYGVLDDETLAAQLERELNRVAPSDSPPVVGSTLAVPSWNHRQARAALENHWDTYSPDVVVYVPISNDLGSAIGLDENGRQRAGPDVSELDPWLIVSRRFSAWVSERKDELKRQGQVVTALGPSITEADLTPESTRRFDANAESILEMKRFVEARGGRFLVFLNGLSPYVLHLSRRLLAAENAPELVFGQRRTAARMTLVDDKHPNAETLGWRAVWVAAELLELGWVPGGDDARERLPNPPQDYSEVHFDPRRPPGLAAQVRDAKALALEMLQSEVSPAELVGVRQVYGGLNTDGSVRFGTSLALRAATRSLSVQLAPVPERRDLAPFDVQVFVNDTPVGAITIEREGPSFTRFPLPVGVALGEAFDVHLRPERWGVTSSPAGEAVVSFQLVRVASE